MYLGCFKITWHFTTTTRNRQLQNKWATLFVQHIHFLPSRTCLRVLAIEKFVQRYAFSTKKFQTCPTHNAFLAILCQPARIPQLQHSTVKVKQEERMKLLIYLVAETIIYLIITFISSWSFSTSVHMILKFRCFRNTFSHFYTYVFVFKMCSFLNRNI